MSPLVHLPSKWNVQTTLVRPFCPHVILLFPADWLRWLALPPCVPGLPLLLVVWLYAHESPRAHVPVFRQEQHTEEFVPSLSEVAAKAFDCPRVRVISSQALALLFVSRDRPTIL